MGQGYQTQEVRSERCTSKAPLLSAQTTMTSVGTGREWAHEYLRCIADVSRQLGTAPELLSVDNCALVIVEPKGIVRPGHHTYLRGKGYGDVSALFNDGTELLRPKTAVFAYGGESHEHDGREPHDFVHQMVERDPFVAVTKTFRGLPSKRQSAQDTIQANLAARETLRKKADAAAGCVVRTHIDLHVPLRYNSGTEDLRTSPGCDVHKLQVTGERILYYVPKEE